MIPKVIVSVAIAGIVFEFVAMMSAFAYTFALLVNAYWLNPEMLSEAL